jgi:hypothetical protein
MIECFRGSAEINSTFSKRPSIITSIRTVLFAFDAEIVARWTIDENSTGTPAAVILYYFESSPSPISPTLFPFHQITQIIIVCRERSKTIKTNQMFHQSTGVLSFYRYRTIPPFPMKFVFGEKNAE